MAKKKNDPERDAAIADDLLIREVDDELRAEKLQNWWQRFGTILIGACATVVVATIAYQFATSYRQSQAEERTSLLLEATSLVEKGQVDTAQKKLATLSEQENGAGKLASLISLGLKDEQNAEALNALSEQNTQAAIRDVARLQKSDYASLSEGDPLYPIAAENKAISLLLAGKKVEARALILSLIGSEAVPSGQRKRLSELLQEANAS